MLCVVVAYFVAIHKLISTFQNPLIRAHSSPTLDDDSDQLTHPAMVADFIKKRRKGRNSSKVCKVSDDDFSRPINVASDGINYYVVLLESPYKGGESRFTTTTAAKSSRFIGKSSADSDADDEGSCSSITEV